MRIPFEEITHTIQRAHWPYLRHVYVTPAVYLKKKLSDKYQAGNHISFMRHQKNTVLPRYCKIGKI